MGVAIAALSFGTRLAMLPLTLWLANRSLDVQLALKRLEPEISKIRAKHKGDPRRMWQETFDLHQKHGIQIMNSRTLTGMLLQVPLFLGVFAAVRRGLSGRGAFLWVKDLIKPDPLLAAVCAILTGVSIALSANTTQQQRTVMIVLPAALTLLFLWWISAGVAIYSFSSSLVGLIQSVLVRRRLARMSGGSVA
jgi:YidC/Oxa1 family membrane protein insertase